MLTLKEPINLISIRGILTVSDTLNEKIRGNYDLLSAQFSPKELLLLLTASPELPEDMGGMTTIAANTNINSNQSLKLDVVNNVINRILMSEHANFTYQDQVYITTVLNKLGITNVAEFMKQVRSLTRDNQNAYELLSLYQNNFELLTSLTSHLDAKLSVAEAKTEQAEVPSEPDLRYFIHNEIYKRLGTGNIYNMLYKFQRNQTVEQSVVAPNELKLAEQLRVSKEIMLSELKSQTFYRSSVFLQHHVNHYEMGDILPAPQTEEHLLSEATAAVLLSAIDNVMVSRMSHIQLKSDFWLDIRNAIRQSAENSLSRFELYHIENSVKNHNQSLYSEQLNALYREEINVVNGLLQQLWQAGAQINITDSLSVSQIQNLKLEHHALMESIEQMTAVDIDSSSEETHTTLSTENLMKATQQIINHNELKQLTQTVKQLPESISETDSKPHISAELIQRTEESFVETGDESPEEKAGLSTETVTKLAQQILNNSEMKQFTKSLQRIPESVSEFTAVSYSVPELVHPADEPVTEPSEEHNDEKIVLSAESVTKLTQQISNKSELKKLNLLSSQTAHSAPRTAMEHRESEVLVHHVRESYAKTIERLHNAEKLILIAQQQPAQEFEYSTQNLIANSLLNDFSKQTTLSQLQSSLEQQNIDAGIRQDTLIYQTSSQEMYDTVENEYVSAQTEEERTLLLQQQLEMINQRNREIYERVQEQKLKNQQTAAPAAPDRKRMLNDALRAIENPEQVIREMLETPPVMQHRDQTPGIDAILAQADETTRKIYEAVIKYQQNPQASIDSGLIRPSNAGTLNADIIKMQKQKTVEMEHRTEAHELETRVIHDTAERVIEQFRELPGYIESYPPQQKQRPRVPIVHKTIESQISDELLERLEQQNRKEEVRQTVDQTVTKETIVQTQVNNLTQDIVAKTTEDITEIVNRTLARQIGTISDRVYSQMEKRLKTERARRGR